MLTVADSEAPDCSKVRITSSPRFTKHCAVLLEVGLGDMEKNISRFFFISQLIFNGSVTRLPLPLKKLRWPIQG